MSTGEGTPFGSHLRRLREAARLSQEELAHRAGLTPNAVGALERGARRRPYPNTVRALADALNLDEGERVTFTASVPGRARSGDLAATLPAPPTAIVGRERELKSVDALLRSDHPRLVTLTGPGGVGKTRLAIEVASRVGGAFTDGVVFVDLAPLVDAGLVLPTLAQSLGLRQTGDSLKEALSANLAPRHLLLILDNFEHVMEAAVDIASLLESCRNLTTLVTSRAPLRIRGEHEYQVAPLEVPDPRSLPQPETVGQAAAARLFVERAGDVAPSFSLNQNNAAAVAAICWRLEGLPLALELAAAQARFVGPTALLSRLDQALHSAGARDLPERQRTVRATIDWSYELLTDEERTAFRRLGVFAGGFTLEAAEAIATEGLASPNDMLSLVGRLVEQSLVTAETPDTEETARYRMLESVRHYSLDRLEESGEAEEIMGRHADYFGALAARAGPELKSANELPWLDELSREHDNLRAALAWLLERHDAERAAEIGWHVSLFWFLRGHLDEGRRWMESLLALERGVSPAARAKALWVVALLSYVQGDIDKAAAALDRRLDGDDAADQETLAHCLVLQGYAAVDQGELDAAEAALSEAVNLIERSGKDRWVIPGALSGKAYAAMAREDFAAAEALIAESVAVARENGERFSLGTSLNVQAMMALLRGDDERASTLLRESLGHATTLQDPWTAVHSLTGLAGTAARAGDGERAARFGGAAEGLRKKTGVDISFPAWRTLYESDLEETRRQIGPDGFDRAWSCGKDLTLEEIVADA